MADIDQHTNYTGAYSGLLDNLYVTIAIAGICVLGHEIGIHVPRRRGRSGRFKRIYLRVWEFLGSVGLAKKDTNLVVGSDLRNGGEALVEEKCASKEDAKIAADRQRLDSRESWEFGYIYQPKAWRIDPAPPVPVWPLAWIFTSLRVRERDMPETCGLDFTLHARFLRGAFFYTLLQAFVVLPILMPLHIFYSPPTIAKSSMVRAGISSLVLSSGSRWLWVHAILIWWITITWTGTVLWITWGGLAYRRREIRRLGERVRNEREASRTASGNEDAMGGRPLSGAVGDDSEGIKRFRTLMVTNIPPDMRDEETLRDYFDYYLHRHRIRYGQLPPPQHLQPRLHVTRPSLDGKPSISISRPSFSPGKLLKKQAEPKAVQPGDVPPVDLPVPPEGITAHGDEVNGEDPVDLNDGLTWDSEVDEIILVRKLANLQNLRSRRMKVLKQLEVAHVKLAQRVLQAVAKHKTDSAIFAKGKQSVIPVHDVEKGVDVLNAARDDCLPIGISKEERMDRLVKALGPYVEDAEIARGHGDETVWDVLHALPRELLDPYQSFTHLTSLFRNQNAPLIDYLTTKLGYLTLLLDEARSKPLSAFAPSSAAFVVFKDARTARLALKVLDSHPKRSLACHTAPAPDWTNLLWPRLSKSVYRSGFVRGWVVFLGVWAFTLMWIFPVSILCALSTLTTIAGFIQPLSNFLAANPKTAAVITSLAPVILVASLTLCICPILLVIANKAETINTRLGIHNSVLERFWKFLMVNGVVFFAIGQTAIRAYLNAFQTNSIDPLPVVASAFPTAAPYFASYILLQTAIQPFFEIFRFGLPTIVYVFGTRVSTIPRQRNSRTENPTFSHFSQVPQQLLGGAIMHLFMLLNPLVIPFTLIYYGACYLIWKRQFTYVYGRLYETNGRRTSIRLLRYSLDALALGQFVLFAFFILNKAKGNAIATGVLFFLTLIAKLIITRALKRRHDNLDIEEGDILCPPVSGDTNLDNDESSDHHEERAGSAENMGTAHKQEGSSRPPSQFATIRHGISSWAGKWGYATSHRATPAGYRKPIPFEHVLFATLDSKISFDGEDKKADHSKESSSMTLNPVIDSELHHQHDKPITHEIAGKVVVPHHALRAWEDIPPYPRSRGYEDQPAYTDEYDDFLWLPRDPLSTLDLDDTVEMRLSLTTSAGGSGRIGDWPPVVEESDAASSKYKHEHDNDSEWQEVIVRRHAIASELPIQDVEASPMATSERRLIQHVQLPEIIGSEVDEGSGSGLIRRGTRKAAEGLTSIFRRPRSGTDHSEGVISMRTLSLRSTPSRTVHKADTDAVETMASPLPDRAISSDSTFLSPVRVATPTEITDRPSSDYILPSVPLSPTPAPKTASLVSFPEQLGRSPSGRRPSRFQTTLNDPNLLRTPSKSTTNILRSPSKSSYTRGRAFSALSRDRSLSALSAQQQALLEEVMAEEYAANKDMKKEELDAKQLEEAEVLKEKDRIRRGSRSVSAIIDAGPITSTPSRPRGLSRGGSAAGSSAGEGFGLRRGLTAVSSGSRSTEIQ